MLDQHVKDLGDALQAPFGIVLAHIIYELFSLGDEIERPLDRGLAESIQNDGYNNISRDDWLCTKCLRELLRRRLFVWWAVQRRAGKVANTCPLPTKNCRCARSFLLCLKKTHHPAQSWSPMLSPLWQ